VIESAKAIARAKSDPPPRAPSMLDMSAIEDEQPADRKP